MCAFFLYISFDSYYMNECVCVPEWVCLCAYALIWNRKGTTIRHWKSNAYIKGTKAQNWYFLRDLISRRRQHGIRRVDFFGWSLFIQPGFCSHTQTHKMWLLAVVVVSFYSVGLLFISFWFWVIWLALAGGWLDENEINHSRNLCMHSIDMYFDWKCDRFVIEMKWKSDLIFL